VWVAAWVDGARPFVAQTIRGYLQGMHRSYLSDPAVATSLATSPPPANIATRFKYNQDFDSIYAMVPSTMALLVFQVPLKGSFLTLLLGTLIYVSATTAYGMLISPFARTQIPALFGTAILTVLPATMFAGMMVPVSSLSGVAQIMGRLFPMTYFLPVSVGTFTKGLGFSDLAPKLAALALFIPVLTLVSLLLLRRQER
jgi:ABC-type multidrug transport system permease subunit